MYSDINNNLCDCNSDFILDFNNKEIDLWMD
ncbi:hypothetical protein BJV38_001347 [Clostridium beijerinckii]|nr:hypothetical protein [Clostridium beijerinckii]NRT44504.1 hypothetical protein [Clostridium beijerinckii]NRZ21504.1 hypothetical protein [Clostridium beijerinckii]